MTKPALAISDLMREALARKVWKVPPADIARQVADLAQEGGLGRPTVEELSETITVSFAGFGAVSFDGSDSHLHLATRK